MTGRLPNFLHIGPTKSGSTWLHEVLITHPQVYLAPAKDLYFFDRYFHRGIEWYRKQFDGARPEHVVVGEVCPEYINCADPRRIKDSLGTAKIMVTLREPGERAFSGYLYMLRGQAYHGTFRQALDDRPDLLDRARYGTWLERYLEHFEKGNVYCGIFDDLQDDPQAFIDSLLSWLGIKPMVLSEAQQQRVLPASEARLPAVGRLAKAGASWAREIGAEGFVGRLKRSPVVLRALYRPLADDRPHLSDADGQWIRERMEPEITRVEELFGLDLHTRWGWDN